MSPAPASGPHVRALRTFATCLCLLLLPGLARATYSSATTAFDFVATGAHTRITSWPGCSDKTGDDSLSAAIDIGFTFNFGGIDYTQVRVHTNGRLQFNNTACGFGTQSVGPPRTYTHPFPDATMDRVMRVYGADLDLASGGFVTVATIGTAPNRRFVVTWNQVGAWAEGGTNNVGAGTAYTYQIQLFEDGEFRYMYGDSDNVSEPSGTVLGPAQIGWQLSSTDFAVARTGLPANRSGLRFFVPGPIAEYRFEQPRLTGAKGEVLDSSGNALHGTRIDSPAGAPRVESVTGRVCRGIDVPVSSNAAHVDAIDTGLPVQKLAPQGTISFWYRSARPWQERDNILIDASTTDNRWFMFGKDDKGVLTFSVTDDSSSPRTLELAPGRELAIGRDTWTHLAISWRLAAGTNASVLRIYLNGALYATASGTTNGSLHRSLSTLYIGDSRLDRSPFDSRPDAAGGLIDEVRIYRYEATQAVILRDMAVTRPCGGIDHFSLGHPGTGITCEATPVKLAAMTADGQVVGDFASPIKLGTSTGRGDWTLLSGSGTLDNGTADDGLASYVFAPGDSGAVAFGLRHTSVGKVDIDVTDGTASERSGAATADDDPLLLVDESGFVFLGDGRPGAIGTQIAGKPSTAAPGAQKLALQAVRTASGTGACEAALLGTQVVDMGFECVSPSRCSGRRLAIDGGSATSIAPNAAGGVKAYTPLKLEFDAAGIAPFAFEFDDAGSVRLHARHELTRADGSGAGDFMQGSSNVFVWRPFALDVTVPDNPGATSASGPAFIAAGVEFGAQVRAVLWSAADDADGDGIADGMRPGDVDPANNARLSDNSTAPNYVPTLPVSLGSTLHRPAGGHHPGLGGSPSASIDAGIAKIQGLRYEEVGIIEISAVQSGDYLGIGTAATAAIRGVSGAVGRFRPARFTVDANVPGFADACAVGAFSYMDQPFHFAQAPTLTLTAIAAGGATTENYTTNGFFRLDTALAGRRARDVQARALEMVTGAPPLLEDTTAGTGRFRLRLPAGAAGDGFAYLRTAPVAPFDAAVELDFPAIDLTDTDQVCHDPNEDGACDDYVLAEVGGAHLRYGRLAADNALGAEVLTLAAPVRAEFFTGNGFVRHDADTCTAIPLAALDLGHGSPDAAPDAGTTSITVGSGSSTASIAFAPLANGLLGLNFSAPGAGNVGEFDYRIDLGVAASAWLRFDWDGDGVPEDPRGRASFGLFAGSRAIVYRRDMWR